MCLGIESTPAHQLCSPPYRDSVTFVTLPLDHADEIFPGTLKRANAARQELLWTLADADEVSDRSCSNVLSHRLYLDAC